MILNVLRRDRVNSVVKAIVNESPSYLKNPIRMKTTSYRVTVTKRITIPEDLPKPINRTIVYRYGIGDESDESNHNCKFVANVVFS